MSLEIIKNRSCKNFKKCVCVGGGVWSMLRNACRTFLVAKWVDNENQMKLICCSERVTKSVSLTLKYCNFFVFTYGWSQRQYCVNHEHQLQTAFLLHFTCFFCSELFLQINSIDLYRFCGEIWTPLHIKSMKVILSGFDGQNGIDACNFALSDVLEEDHSYMVR